VFKKGGGADYRKRSCRSRKKIMINFKTASAVSLLLAGSAATALCAGAVDTLSGVVTDSATGYPLEQVSVGSEGFAAATDASGNFRLIFSAVDAALPPSRRSGSPEISWDPARRRFSWPGNLGVTSALLQNVRGEAMARRILGAGGSPGEFPLPELPLGIYLATLRGNAGAETFRVAALPGGALSVRRISSAENAAAQAGLSKAAATGAAHVVAFTKAGYKDFSLSVPAGTSGPLSVKLQAAPPGQVVRIFDGKTVNGWTQVPAASWNVQDSSLASLGKARGFIYPTAQWSHYRVIFSIREVSGNHNPCVLVFGTDPKLDAMGAIQFQLPYGVGWDYRPGHNNTGAQYYTKFPDKGKMSNNQWSRCEILVDASKGLARAACAQPVGAKAVPILTFKDPAIKNAPGYFALQMHNSGIHDEYKDITVEVNPTVDDLITTK
jgi:hypothetical protein